MSLQYREVKKTKLNPGYRITKKTVSRRIIPANGIRFFRQIFKVSKYGSWKIFRLSYKPRGLQRQVTKAMVVSGVNVWTKTVLAVPWKLPATVKWQRRLVGCSICEERQRRRHGHRLF